MKILTEKHPEKQVFFGCLFICAGVRFAAENTGTEMITDKTAVFEEKNRGKGRVFRILTTLHF